MPNPRAMDLIVKICGLSTEETLDAALAAGADMVGLVFFPPSPRFIAAEAAGRLARQARGRAEVVALTVDMDDAALGELVETVRPDWLQLHGKETPEEVAAVRRRFGIKAIKAIHVSSPDDLRAARTFADAADMILLDAKPPESALLPGGNGTAFDWTILRSFRPSKPYLLSGGLSAANIAEAIDIAHPPGVDVSSGVESARGKKDVELIRSFIKAARNAAAIAARERVAS